jgi:hypothetical protein
MIVPARQFFDRQRFAVMRAVLPAGGKKHRSVSFVPRIPKELLDACPHILTRAICPTILKREAHKMPSIEIIILFSSAVESTGDNACRYASVVIFLRTNFALVRRESEWRLDSSAQSRGRRPTTWDSRAR